MAELKIVYLPPGELKPYENNARRHAEEDLATIRASIKAFGFRDPIAVWGPQNIIVEGHGRQIVAQEIGLETVPVIRLDDMTDEERKAYALAHNKTAELSEWDFSKLDEELARLQIEEIDMGAFDFDMQNADWFDRQEKDGGDEEEGNDEYNEFLHKFEIKKTTDDCYTPENIYDAVADWVAEEYGLSRRQFVRPFFPCGDYKSEKYPKGAVVVDNPPFSILAEIIKFYNANKVKFFLFAPTLTLFTATGEDVEYVPCGVKVTYENGANVSTSFINNLGENRIYVCAELYRRVKEQNDINEKEMHKELPNYIYPLEAVTAARVYTLAKYGQDFKVPKAEAQYKGALDAMKEAGKEPFGGVFLISERAAAEHAAAERAAAERAAAERAAAERAAAGRAAATTWKLSGEEQKIIKNLAPKT